MTFCKQSLYGAGNAKLYPVASVGTWQKSLQFGWGLVGDGAAPSGS